MDTSAFQYQGEPSNSQWDIHYKMSHAGGRESAPSAFRIAAMAADHSVITTVSNVMNLR